LLERGIQGLLKSFFAEMLISDPPNGYSRPEWTAQIQTPGGSIPGAIPLADDELLALEPLMSKLRQANRDTYDVLYYHYGLGWSDSKIGAMRIFSGSRLHRSEISAIRSSAERRLEVQLDIEGL